jgi:hypothetical protein
MGGRDYLAKHAQKSEALLLMVTIKARDWLLFDICL